MRIAQPEDPGEPVALSLARFLLARRLGTGDASARVFVEGIAGVVASQSGGPPIKEADDLARTELAAKRPVSIFGSEPNTVGTRVRDVCTPLQAFSA